MDKAPPDDTLNLDESVLEGEQHLALRLNGAGGSGYVWDLLTGVIVRTPHSDGLFGGQPEQTDRDISCWIGRIHPDDRERVHQRLDAAIRAPGGLSVEYRTRNHDGSWRWVRDEGQISGF